MIETFVVLHSLMSNSHDGYPSYNCLDDIDIESLSLDETKNINVESTGKATIR